MFSQTTTASGDDVMVTVKKSYLDALEALAQSVKEHEAVKSQFWPAEKAVIFNLKTLDGLKP